MAHAHRKWPFSIRRCSRCTREAAVVVRVDPRRVDTVAVCAEHLEWAFFADVTMWSGRRPAA
ncbi:MAG TPA: hypothetical protein VD813_16265 [Pseudonocardia sp.]|nr:hypothetical protein [Pseudonocardia sp.]